MKVCPICNKEFKPKRKTSKTCSRKCGGILGAKNTPKILKPCKICGKQVKIKICNKKLPTYCSDECRLKRHTKICLMCNSEFTTPSSQTKLCSEECAIKYKNTKLLRTEKCYCCDKEFTRPTITFGSNRDRYFCSKRCRERTFGRENRFRYGKNWNYMRNVRLFIDKRRCVKCGAKENLEVHHFIPKRLFQNPDDAHYLNNLITLCKECHKIVEDCDKEKYKNVETVSKI